MNAPYFFDEFFAAGKDESISPFLTGTSRRWSRNLSLKSSFLSALFLVLAFSVSWASLPLSNLLLTGVFFLAGTPALIDAIEDLKSFEINIDMLMTLAAFLAIAIDSALEGALLLVLFEVSGALEETVSRKTKGALNNLNYIAPRFALIAAEDGTTYEKSVRDIGVGEKLLIKAGEIVPLDAIVVAGTSSVNLVHLTGESIPDPKVPGDEVPAGARNLDAALTVAVKRTSSESTLQRIVRLILQAQEAKPRLQRWLDRFGKTYATSIIALTVLFALALPLFSPMAYTGPEGSVYRALAFLIAASPCALIIATPTAYLSAISASAKKGILLKGGITLDAIASCSLIAFDKTGTLTTGDLLCTSIEPIGSSRYTPSQALGIAASLERHVVHPIASAIVRHAQEQNAPLAPISCIKAIPGYGVEGMIEENTPVAIGLIDYVAKGRSLSIQEDSHGAVLSALSIGEELFVFRFTDRVREEMPTLMANLQARYKLTPYILTGDREHNAKRVAALLGVPRVFANLRPEDKLAKVSALAEQGGLMMVGDGINDAPALARATVGVSMGRIGSATAVDASDVVLLNDDLHLIGWLVGKARLTRRIIKQNVALALGVIALATTPALLGWVPLWLAVVLHEGGTVLVGLNSLRLLRK